MQQTTEYSAVVAAVQSALNSDLATESKWQKVAAIVPAFFGTAEALIEVKAQFIADAILPIVPKRHAEALAVDLPRKNGKEYKALDETGRKKWAATDEAKKLARATLDSSFKRVLAKAFPPVKKESDDEGETATLKTKLAKMLADAIGKCEKVEAPDFDVSATLTGLRAALAAVSK
jgi:hypothetical protein